MGLLTRLFLKDFRNWERRAQVALLTGVVMFLAVVAVGFSLPPDERGAALVSAVVVLVVLQFIVLWANRHMVTPHTQAQRQYLAGDFAAARDTLLAEQARRGRLNVDSLTLLGNIYRQMGDLDKSQDVLTQAIQLKPEYHFPWYGFARTLLIKGDYAGALEAFEAALKFGAPRPVWVDCAEARYLSGAPADAVMDALSRAQDAIRDDAPRQMMASYLRWRAGGGELPSVSADGSAYWQATAERFAGSPYVRDLVGEVAQGGVVP